MDSQMKRVQAVWEHPLYQQNLKDLTRLEADRVFCRHTPEHFLDVARLAYIFALERKLNCSRELIYCTALLHDIGKWEQYENGTPHELSSARIAEEILSGLPPHLRFSPEETETILTAIRGHRKLRETPELLEALLYESDKASRTCFSCPASEACNWDTTKKNKEIDL